MDLPQQQANLEIVEKPKNKDVTMEQVKSRAVVKYSSVHIPTDFARLQCNTNLNLPPSNWLTSYAESYGLHHTLANSSGFSSFRMAHMFPDCITEVDVVSDAENIKKLLKIPYSRNAVSMMVHCIEKTLLIDEFDIHKHLLRTTESDWEWFRKFFFDNVLQTLSEKRLGASTKDKSRHVLQERALVSKFLHYSLTEPELADDAPLERSTDDNEETFTKIWPPLPEPKPEEQLPDPSTNQTFNRNVVWTFEDIQMLLGTNMPIFGGTTHPCISLRLRDANKPISVLTGIDYWLDNLMCNVPEVVMCYHLDGIVQRYELVKTEDLPHLANSKFSPNLIRGVAQNILSFLKSNATKAGHTYWLFKGKDEDVVKLYDLTSLCSESLVDQGQNPFTVPVAMLLYRVARNMKHSLDPASQKPGTIRALLNNCLDLLPKEKYPQIVTSAHYMLSDLYLPMGFALECLQGETDSKSPEPPDHDTSLINTFSISDDLDPPPLPPYEPPPPLVGSLAERCHQALQHVVAGLQCLQFFEIASPSKESGTTKTDKNSQSDAQQEPRMAYPHQPIPMHYSSLTPEKSRDNKSEEVEVTPAINNKKKNKKKKNSSKSSEKINNDKKINESLNDKNKNIVDSLEQYPVYFWNSGKTALLHKQQTVPLPTWQAPNPTDTASWKGHLKTLLYEKACLVYNLLAETDHSAKRYGESLRCVGLVLRSHAHMAAGCGRCTSLVSVVLCLAGDNCFHLAQDFENIDVHRADFTTYNDTDTALLAEMEQDMPAGTYPYECMIMPETLESVEQLMLSSLTCYQQALLLRPKDALHSRIGNVHNELSTIYMNKINAINTKDLQESVVRTKITTLLKLCEHHLELGKDEFIRLNDKYNTALLLANSGRLMRMKAVYLGYLDTGLQNIQRSYYNSALDLYDKGLGVLGNRKVGPHIWDVIRWEKSCTLYTMTTIYQDCPPSISEKSEDEVERELIDLFTKALQSCDLETAGPRQCMYQFRAAMLHYRLASLYQAIYRKKHTDDAKRKHILHLVNLHFEKSANLMEYLEHPIEFLRLQLEQVALQEFIAENSGGTAKFNALRTALVYLRKCSPVLESIAERYTANQSESSTHDLEKSVDREEKDEEELLLALYQARVEFVLKSLVKVTLSSQKPKMYILAAKYKEMYSMVLKQEPGVGLPIHLKNVATILQTFSLS